jgi:L-ascorbate metabolism protein UlaG (beta-lactamase superfamily)
MDKKSINEVLTDNTVIVCPKSSANKLKKFNTTALDPNESTEIAGIKITAVPAYNPDKAFHPKGNKWVGYVIEAGGKKVYHAGDTGAIPEMKKLSGIDVAMIPAGGQYTMGFEDVVEVAKMIKPTILVPMHSWDKDLSPLKDMVSGAVPSVTVEILEAKDLEI